MHLVAGMPLAGVATRGGPRDELSEGVKDDMALAEEGGSEGGNSPSWLGGDQKQPACVGRGSLCISLSLKRLLSVPGCCQSLTDRLGFGLLHCEQTARLEDYKTDRVLKT